MLFFALVNQQSYSSIACDVNRGTRHIQDTVDTCDKSRAFQRQTKAGQNHGQHDEACARNTCSTDRSQSTGNDNGHVLGSSEVNAVQLSNEQCAYTLISSSTIHVDGCAQWQNEAGNFFRSAHFLSTAHGQRQSTTGGAGARSQRQVLSIRSNQTKRKSSPET